MTQTPEMRATSGEAPRTPPVIIHALNPFRGVVCLSIVLLHYGAATKDVVPEFPMSVFHFRPGVESFFVLAGFLTARTLRPDRHTRSVARMLVARFIRLAVPFWAALLLITVIKVAAFVFGNRPAWPDLPHPSEFLFINDLLGHKSTDAFLWSLSALMQMTAFTLIAFWIIRRVAVATGDRRPHERAIATWTVVCAVVLAMSCVARCFGFLAAPINTPARWWACVEWAWPFAAGFLVQRASVRAMPRGVAVVAAALVAAGLFTLEGDIYPSGARWCWAGITTVLLYLLSRYNPSVPRYLPLTWLGHAGRWSFGVYLMHGTVWYPVYRRICGIGPGADHAPTTVACAVVVALAVSVFFGWVFHRAIETPTARLVSRITRRQNGTSGDRSDGPQPAPVVTRSAGRAAQDEEAAGSTYR